MGEPRNEHQHMWDNNKRYNTDLITRTEGEVREKRWNLGGSKIT